MSSLIELTLAQALDGLKTKKFTATELTQAYITATEKCRSLNAYIVETPELALKQAKESDARYVKGTALPLDGLPLGIKDLFCTDDVQTTAGSNILRGFKPQYESTVTSQLFRDGAVMLGKLNLDEFAMGSANITSAYGNVINPWSGADPANAARKLVPGGSSGGSAAAVAARCAIAATGTDTGGSIRQPAAFTGITGIKPTYGRCSRWGIVAYASSLDQAGPMTRDVRDAAIMLRSMAGYDPKDSTSVNRPVPNYLEAIEGGIAGLRIGIPKEYRVDGMPAEIETLWLQGIKMLQDAGAEIVDISLPHTKYALATYYIVATAECSSNLARYDGVRYGQREAGKNLIEMYENTRAKGFGAEVRRRIMLGTYVLSAGYYDAYYLKGQKVRNAIARDFGQAFKQCDAILTPTAPSDAFAIGEKQDDPIKMWLNDVFTVPVNLAGLPAMSLPVGLSANNLPLGLQIIGRPFDESTVLGIGAALEAAANFKALPPFHA
ncbi:MAG: Asp-tRNA(Asn)/Glu-tRNA(Gln) amidotransferase subunit GatA [Alphaproteobacteria bacterium]|nr:Asp-tRNA(Asn)/Glu-tRNA(Gln) amidotransferase subunit GatA [Alphaproteobacteria bacterium]